MTYGTKNYGAVASAYGPLTRNMPKSKATTGHQDGNNQWKQKQKVLHGSLLEYTKRMDKIKQARMAISKSKEEGRLSSVPKQRRHFKMVLPGLDQLENDALSLTNKFISQAQFQSATKVADKVNEQTNEVLPSESKVKSSIFSNDVQERSKASPNAFKQNWRVLKNVKVRHVPVLKTKDGVVYSTVTRPAKINNHQESEVSFEDTKTTVVKLDENGNAITNVTNESFRKYHPGILPMPGMKGPYKAKVTLHVSLPQMENEFDGDSDDENDTSSCSIDLPNDGSDSQSSSRVQTPNHTVVDHEKEVSSETLQNKGKFEAAISSNSKDITSSTTQDKTIRVQDVTKSSERNGTCNDQPSGITRLSKTMTDKSSSFVAKTAVVPATTKTLKPPKKLPLETNHGEKNHFPCADCPVCKAEMESKETPPAQTSILKKNDKPLPDIKSSSGQGSVLEKKKTQRGSLQQVTLPGGVMKLGKLTYHRTYKINVRPVPPHMKNMVGGVNSELTLHDSFADAVKGTDVLGEAERTLRFEKNRKENQERRKKFSTNTEEKLMHPLCRHGRFVHECYTCRAVEEIRQRLKNSYSSSEQQYQWNLLSKHERHLTQNVNVAKVKPQMRKNASFRLSAISKATDISQVAEDTSRPDGRPGGRVITEKDEGRANPQGLLPTGKGNGEKSASIENQDEESANKKVRFAEERIYDPMRGTYRQGSSNNDQMLVPPLKN